ncbi:hypothetical protein Syun_030531 [Stephania yunnanensis]|uniref:Uncharacterized protein n=1 Tax=Stephania yunnanensis TaxID=152371 RepID=A0AAP0DXI9_9MAGN
MYQIYNIRSVQTSLWRTLMNPTKFIRDWEFALCGASSLMRDDTKIILMNSKEEQGIQESYIANSSWFNQAFNVFASASSDQGLKNELLPTGDEVGGCNKISG